MWTKINRNGNILYCFKCHSDRPGPMFHHKSISILYPHLFCCYILFKICILPFDNIELFLTPNSQCFVIMVSRCSMLQEAKPFAVMCATLLIMVPLVLLSLWSFTTCFCLRMFCTFLCLSSCLYILALLFSSCSVQILALQFS